MFMYKLCMSMFNVQIYISKIRDLVFEGLEETEI